LSHKDRYARWTLKFTKAKRQDDGTMPSSDLVIPFFGYKSQVSIAEPGSGLKSLRDPPIVSSFVKHEPGPAALTGQE